jgi:competence protein ComEA
MNKQHLRWAASAVVLALVALIVLRSWQSTQTDNAALLITGDNASTPAGLPSIAAAPRSLPSASPQMIVVDVIGAVQAPGVYILPLGARAVAAVEAAGGLAPTADRERINLAAPVQDGAQVACAGCWRCCRRGKRCDVRR